MRAFIERSELGYYKCNVDEIPGMLEKKGTDEIFLSRFPFRTLTDVWVRIEKSVNNRYKIFVLEGELSRLLFLKNLKPFRSKNESEKVVGYMIEEKDIRTVVKMLQLIMRKKNVEVGLFQADPRIVSCGEVDNVE